MTLFKQPSFQDRAGQVADAKKKALEQLRRRPKPDEKVVAQRIAADALRQAAQAEKEAAKKAAAEAAAQSKATAAAKVAAPIPSEAEKLRGTLVMPQGRLANSQQPAFGLKGAPGRLSFRFESAPPRAENPLPKWGGLHPPRPAARRPSSTAR